MIASVKNRAALVRPVIGEYVLPPLLVVNDARVVGARESDRQTLRQVDARLERKGYRAMRKRYRPKPKENEYPRNGRRPTDQGGAVIRPSVLRAMEELRRHVEKQFPA